MSMQSPGGPPRERVIDVMSEPRYVDTATPGIQRAIPSRIAHFGADVAPCQFWRAVFDTPITPGNGDSSVVQWRNVGDVIGITLGTDLNTPESYGTMGVKITAGPEKAALTMEGEGGSPDFMRFSEIVGVAPAQYPSRLYRPVCRDDRWTVEVFNFNSNGHAYLPLVCFHFRPCLTEQDLRGRGVL